VRETGDIGQRGPVPCQKRIATQPRLDQGTFKLAQGGDPGRAAGVDVGGLLQHVMGPRLADAGRQPMAECQPLRHARPHDRRIIAQPLRPVPCGHIGQDRRRFRQDKVAIFQNGDGARRIYPKEGGTAVFPAGVKIDRAQVKPRLHQRGQKPNLVAIRAKDVVIQDHAATNCAP
jgi:hypothetical protein